MFVEKSNEELAQLDAKELQGYFVAKLKNESEAMELRVKKLETEVNPASVVALENEVKTGMLMCNPRVTCFTSFAKAVLNFIDDKKAPRTKKNLYTYLVANGYYRDLHSYTWSDR